MVRKLAVFFPGIGYTMDRPLLHFSRRIAEGLGYEIKPLPYTGFPAGVRGDRGKMEECFRIALSQSRDMLSDLDWNSYEEIVFVGKSVGTIAAAALAAECPVKERIRQILFTPLVETFSFPIREAIVFTGTEDPWTGGARSRIRELCTEQNIPCTVVPKGNHSLESGSWQEDLDNLKRILEETEAFLRRQRRIP